VVYHLSTYDQKPLIRDCLSKLVESDTNHIDQVLDHQLQFEEKHLIIQHTNMSHNTKALIEKVKSIGVKLHSYFDSDAIISLDILLDGLNSNTTCNTCIEHIDNNPVQCASCFHQYHKKCQNVSYVLKKKSWFCNSCVN
jgi:hypothetical protein